MNKILLSAIFLSFIILACPVSIRAATMQVTVTINSIQMPARAAMLYVPGNTDFQFNNMGRISIVRDAVGTISVTQGSAAIVGINTQFTKMFKANDYMTANSEMHQIVTITDDTHMTVSTAYPNTAWAHTATNISYLGTYMVFTSGTANISSGYSTTLAFPYDSTLAPYSVHLELIAWLLGGVQCNADCTPIAANLGFYSLGYGGAYEYVYYLKAKPSTWAAAACPTPPCVNGLLTSLGVSPANVVTNGNYYWRSPSLCTIGSLGNCGS